MTTLVEQPGRRRAACLEALQAQLSSGALVLDPDIVEGYRHDRAKTIKPGVPLALVRAADVADVQATLRVAARFEIPVVPRGAGTGLSGGSSAVDGAITLSTERMRWIEVDRMAMTAVVGPGMLNAEVKSAAREHGLWYPPDPSSFEICSIGGNLATNAGGLCCVKYGVTTDYVLALQVVLADGRALRLGGTTVKNVAGYDLKRLFVGSEGTLGVITEATLRLRPAQPPPATVAATFDDVVAAGRAVIAVMCELRPSALELMDGAAIAAVEAVRPMGLEDAGAVLIGQSDVSLQEAERMAALFSEAGATFIAVTDDLDEGELLMGGRRMAIPCVERLGAVLIEDVGVPVPLIADLIAAVVEIASRHDTLVPVIGHAGDGNLHPLVTFDPNDGDAVDRAEATFHDIMRAAIELGGTVTGEHGIGSLKALHLPNQLGDEVMELTRRVKDALDPSGILNPGKWI
jgi:glycolate oxidase